MDFRGKRLLACVIDHFIFGSIASIIAFPGFVFDHLSHPFELRFPIGSTILNAIAVNAYIAKDVISNGVAKKLLYLQILNTSNDRPPRLLQLYLRNITFIVWPLEIILLSHNPEKRLGDLIARTKVVTSTSSDPAPSPIFARIGVFVLTLPIAYGIAFGFKSTMDRINELLPP